MDSVDLLEFWSVVCCGFFFFLICVPRACVRLFGAPFQTKRSRDFENFEVSRGGYFNDFRTIWPGLAYVWGSTDTQWHFPYSFVPSMVN